LADPTRRRILELLRTGSRSAGELGEHFGTSAATVSHHLAVLKEAGLVTDEKQGKYVYYELNTTVVQDVMTWAAGLLGKDAAAHTEEAHTHEKEQ
jgi:DNA-binding transcriptional ArsR family regulator